MCTSGYHSFYTSVWELRGCERVVWWTSTFGSFVRITIAFDITVTRDPCLFARCCGNSVGILHFSCNVSRFPSVPQTGETREWVAEASFYFFLNFSVAYSVSLRMARAIVLYTWRKSPCSRRQSRQSRRVSTAQHYYRYYRIVSRVRKRDKFNNTGGGGGANNTTAALQLRRRTRVPNN